MSTLAEQIARIIDPDAWEPFSADPIFMLAEDRRRSLAKADQVLALLPLQGEVVEALRPFAEAAEYFNRYPELADDLPIGVTALKVGDLRRAAEAYAKAKPEIIPGSPSSEGSLADPRGG